MRVYVDEYNKCHATNPDGAFKAEENTFFDNKCDTFIEGHCYEIKENCAVIYPWKDCSELDAAQREYEKQLLAEYAAALNTLGVKV